MKSLIYYEFSHTSHCFNIGNERLKMDEFKSAHKNLLSQPHTVYYYRTACPTLSCENSQSRHLYEYAAANKSNPFIMYIDNGYNGMDMNRPALSQMRADMQQGNIKHIIVDDISRLARDIEMMLFLLKEADSYHVGVQTVDGINLGEILEEYNKIAYLIK